LLGDEGCGRGREEKGGEEMGGFHGERGCDPGKRWKVKGKRSQTV
jgi:hypothetical protein